MKKLVLMLGFIFCLGLSVNAEVRSYRNENKEQVDEGPLLRHKLEIAFWTGISTVTGFSSAMIPVLIDHLLLKAGWRSPKENHDLELLRAARVSVLVPAFWGLSKLMFYTAALAGVLHELEADE